MRNASEVVREVRIDNLLMAPEHQRLHLGYRLLGIAPGAVAILLRRKIGLENRFQHQHRCCHAGPIPESRNAQRPKFAVSFRYEHTSDGMRPVGSLLKRKRQFAKPPLHAILFDIREVLAVHTRRAPVGAAQGIGMRQNIHAENLVVQSVEAVAGFSLRFCV